MYQDQEEERLAKQERHIFDDLPEASCEDCHELLPLESSGPLCVQCWMQMREGRQSRRGWVTRSDGTFGPAY